VGNTNSETVTTGVTSRKITDTGMFYSCLGLNGIRKTGIYGIMGYKKKKKD
jgi:hypothetical protein